jgi:tetratricopeptide (TPR) repeat protein
MAQRSKNKTAKTESPTGKPNPGLGLPWIAVFLIVINLLAYAPVWRYGFVNYDDPQYVKDNPDIKDGLTLHGVSWAFTTGYQANWHPITWLSHMTDIELFGFKAGGHHLTNLLFHIGNTILLFWLLLRMTGAPFCSVFVAALFAVHPVHVQSVAWIAERKDVLSTFFFLLTLGAYFRYVREPRPTRYLPILVFCGLGLMAKPMLVTLPFVLLLLDFWPLGRMTFGAKSSIRTLIIEKVPLFVLSAASSVITVIVQQKGGAVAELEAVPMIYRVANASIAYFAYIKKMFWPTDLAVLYPTTLHFRAWWVAPALGLIALSILAFRAAKRQPYITVGWFWYLGTLVPVIGLVQVGKQAMADRYTYIPSIGLLIVVVFGLANAAGSRPERNTILATVGGLAVGACIWLTSVQLGYWSSSEALWEHTISITTDNSMALLNLGDALLNAGKVDEATKRYFEALRIEPQSAEAHYGLGLTFTKSGRANDAIAHFDEALRLAREGKTLIDDGRLATAHFNIGILRAKQGQIDDAGNHFADAVRANPRFAEAQNSLGAHLMVQGKFEEALTHLQEAIRLKPDFATAHNNLGTVLGKRGQVAEAIAAYTEAVRLQPTYADAHVNLGILLSNEGKTDDAIAHFTEALRSNSESPAARAWLSSLTSKPNVK